MATDYYVEIDIMNYRCGPRTGRLMLGVIWPGILSAVIAAAGVHAAPGATTIRPSADGTLRDSGAGGVLTGNADTADWYFNETSFEGAITLNTAEPQTTFEDRVVWEYNVDSFQNVVPVVATLNFTVRGAPAIPRPVVQVHVYAYDADLAERLSDFSCGPAVLQEAVSVAPYQPPTSYWVSVSGFVNDALARGITAVGFRFQVDPETPFSFNQAFIDALDAQPETKPFLKVYASSPGDLTGDGGVTLEDIVIFYECLAGPSSYVGEECAPADLTSDGTVDLHDLQRLQVLFDLKN